MPARPMTPENYQLYDVFTRAQNELGHSEEEARSQGRLASVTQQLLTQVENLVRQKTQERDEAVRRARAARDRIPQLRQRAEEAHRAYNRSRGIG